MQDASEPRLQRAEFGTQIERGLTYQGRCWTSYSKDLCSSP